ncbi:MAG: hypothetical protein SOT68_02835 [Oscillospiraceae bacterium]|nr:hypothetical protein [Oscillospiraceae bacterium]MDD7278112.1 hypothetical protein [Oscillospiraceae bacterium]MDY2863112.1 hypothetical protein [Oscillospiraceae bacterium]
MANCKNCGGELFETSKFCPHCGAPVLEMSARPEGEKVKDYSPDATSDNVEGLPEVNTGVLTPEEQAAVLEMAAENILEDIPDIKKIEDDKEIKENTSASDDVKKDEAPKAETVSLAKEEAKPEKKNAPKPAEEKAPEVRKEPESKPQTAAVSAEPAKKSKGGIISVIAIVAVAAIGGAVFLLKPQNTPAPPLEIEQTELSEAVTEETAIEADAEISVADETELVVTEKSADTEISTETEITSGTEASEESVTESETKAEETETSAETAAVGGHTADELTEGIIIEPTGHSTAMGNAVSAEIKLSDEGIGTDILTSGVLFLAEYTSTASAPANITPASMVITINGTAIDVAATSCSEGMVIFEYDKMTEAVTAAGFSPADIDDIAIKTTGVPIDVYKITLLQS